MPQPQVYHPSSSISKSWTPPRQAKPEKKLVATELCGNMISFFIFSSGGERSMASKSFTSSCLILKGEARIYREEYDIISIIWFEVTFDSQEKGGDKEKYKPLMLQRVEDTSRDLRTRESETCNNDMFWY
ncbi:hypothetical protein DY000_02035596 [Brassica cretica]|uniref:Uncharacterized protein n=1 Tax=Brassica cretica TaxID=69181 RepID=A0ABQ7DWH1_BRACR|nr:hypothetical protein DY000_02035596 [Brassica cretica]